MSVTFHSVRFGTIEIQPHEAIEFPFGLIGLGGLRYALIDRNPGTGFLWLHSVDDPALALPVVSPHLFFPEFRLDIAAEDRERCGLHDEEPVTLYVTVRAAPTRLTSQPICARRWSSAKAADTRSSTQTRTRRCRRRCSRCPRSTRLLHNQQRC